LEEYEKVVKSEYDKLIKLKKKFNSGCIILGEVGIDVVGGKFVGNDESKIMNESLRNNSKEWKDKIEDFSSVSSKEESRQSLIL